MMERIYPWIAHLAAIPRIIRTQQKHHNMTTEIVFKRRVGPDPHEGGKQSAGAHGCPDIFELGDGDFAIIGEDVTGSASALPADASCGPDERIVRIPRATLIGARSEIPEA